MNDTTEKRHHAFGFLGLRLQGSVRFFLLAAFLVHFLQLLACWLVGYLPLVSLNVASCAVYLSLLLIERKHPALAATLAELEVICFAMASTVLAGLQGGFFLYLVCLLALIAYLGDAVEGCRFTAAVQTLDLMGLAALLCASRRLPVSLAPYPAPEDSALFFFFATNLAICVSITLLSVYLSSQTLRRRNQELVALNANLEYLASHDPLTGLQNRRNLYKQLESLCSNTAQNRHFCAALCDIDNFKAFNDQYGHNHGDLVLVAIAECITGCVRADDIVCRWGGEEILILFPGTPLDAAREVVGRIQSQLHQLTASGESPFFREVTLTFGLTQHASGQSPQDLVAQADRLLYQGKQAGKNCVIC